MFFFKSIGASSNSLSPRPFAIVNNTINVECNIFCFVYNFELTNPNKTLFVYVRIFFLWSNQTSIFKLRAENTTQFAVNIKVAKKYLIKRMLKDPAGLLVGSVKT